MHERKSEHAFGTERSNDHRSVPSVDLSAGDEGIDDPDISERDSPDLAADDNTSRRGSE